MRDTRSNDNGARSHEGLLAPDLSEKRKRILGAQLNATLAAAKYVKSMGAKSRAHVIEKIRRGESIAGLGFNAFERQILERAAGDVSSREPEEKIERLILKGTPVPGTNEVQVEVLAGELPEPTPAPAPRKRRELTQAQRDAKNERDRLRRAAKAQAKRQAEAGQ